MLTTNRAKQTLPSKFMRKTSSLLTTRISYKKAKQKFKYLLHNMSVAKQLQSNTMLIVALLAVVAIVGLFNQTSMNSRLASFYKDSYAIETAALYAKSSLSTIQTSLYKAMLTEKPNLQTKYVNQSEEAYTDMLSHLEVLYKSTDDIKSLKISDKEELIGELDKATRYRDKIKEAASSNDIKTVFSIYKNDYAPILVSISATLDIIIANASTYADMYIDQSQRQTIISIILFIILTLMGILSAVILSKLTAKHILEPVNEIEYCLSNLADGNLEYTFEYSSRNELGKVCQSTQKTLQTLQQYIRGITSVLKQLESKNLTVELTTDYKGDFIPIKESLESICHFLNDNIHIIKNSSEHISDLSREVNDQSLTIEKGAKEQTKTLDTLYMNLNDI
ncbi:MAG TPA: MCP four helix bundle domain-containing protein, partial [Lachnospiraceae bacterium]|nr:MCP four helix bundle domain-containing protein [Lachnospiraceae bacterium]